MKIGTQMQAYLQSVALQRCASCERWQGERSARPHEAVVEVPDEHATGLCHGGPWDGQVRRARSACGHWVRWAALAPGISPDS